MEPLISIIIPTYNRASIIGETLDSIIEQSYTNWECIVVDDGSSDNTDKVLANYCKKDARFQYYHRPQNKKKGPCSCRNYGFKKSKGTLINFFDSDDLYKHDTFQIVINNLKVNNDVIIVRTELVNMNTQEIININNTKSSLLVQDFFTENIMFYVCGPFWKKEFLINQSKLFDENIRNGDDWDFNLRMLYKHPKITFISSPLIKYRAHTNSLAKEKIKLNIEEIKPYFNLIDEHLKILKNKKDVNYKIIMFHVFKKYNKFFKMSLFQNNKNKYYFLLVLLKKEFQFSFYKRALKTLLGFVLYNYLKKGYFLLKD